MDEYQLEIQTIRRTLNRLRSERAAPHLIEEYEEELRNLNALYEAALETFETGRDDRRLVEALIGLGFGPWTLGNVYSFVYDVVMDADLGRRTVAQVAREIDFAGSLRAASALD